MAANTTKQQAFLGKNERLSRASLHDREGLYVADAKNVDVSGSKHFLGRAGYTKVVSGAGMHSLWATRDGRAFVVSEGQLCLFDHQAMQLHALGLSLPASALLAYAELPGGDVAVSDGRAIHRITPDNTVLPMIHDAPAPTPQAVVQVGQPDRSFLYCFAYADMQGAVGLCSPINRVEAAELAFEVPVPPDGLKLQLYVSHPNGEVAYLMAESLGGTVQCGEVRRGGVCPTQHLQPLPPGDILVTHAGRLYSVRGSVVYFSEPYLFGAMSAGNFIPMPTNISLVAPVGEGCFIVADKTYWMRGTNPDEAALVVVSGAEAVPHSLAWLDDGRPVWESTMGIVIGNPDGSLEELTSEVMPGRPVEPGTIGASLAAERNNAKQVISNRRREGYARAGVYMTAE